ncbi:MAG: hypothetical protein NWE94_08690 [Candidatus Bathyarchaeota archaeon]|nr:hypothetical protein [Candidatus Bathyarchaeota archaeon]
MENRTYDKWDIPLNLAVNEPATQITYSLDGAENVTISGNLTLNGLLDGVHSLTVYAKDHAGNVGASETINFTITTPKTEPPPTMPIAATATAVSTAAAVAGLLAYHRKRH